MAPSTVIDADALALAGITADSITAMFIGKTKAQCASMYLTAFQLAIANASIQRGAVKVYNLEGQSTEVDMEQARKTVAFLRDMRSCGGPVAMGVTFS